MGGAVYGRLYLQQSDSKVAMHILNTEIELIPHQLMTVVSISILLIVIAIIGLVELFLSKLYLNAKYKSKFCYALIIRYILIFISLVNIINYFIDRQKIINKLTELFTMGIISKSFFIIIINIATLFDIRNWTNKKSHLNELLSLLKSGRCFQYINSDLNYGTLVNGKNIAIVGSAYSKKEDGNEIDNFDLVIRTAYKNNLEYNTKYYGEKTDLSYYNVEGIETYGQEFFEKIAKIIFLLFKFNIFNYQTDLVINYKARFCQSNSFFSPGEQNQVTLIVNDLLYFSPRRIKIFKSDLYSEKRSYYLDESEKIDKIVQTVAGHDGFSQLLLFKFFKKITNYIEYDETLDRLANESLWCYAKRLENKFSKR